MILLFPLLLVAGLWLFGVEDPAVLVGGGVLGLIIAGVMRTDRGAAGTLAGFASGIVIMLGAVRLLEDGHIEQAAAAWIGLAGVALMAGSLTRHVRGR